MVEHHTLIFLIVASLLLAWVASFWSSNGFLNLFIKSLFAVTAVFGAFEVAVLAVKVGAA